MIPALLIFLSALQDPKVPDGFVIEKVAESTFPMFGCFDDQGRLYVTESSGGDLYLELQKLTRGCRVRRFSADFKTSTVFAENLTPSMGLAWRDGKLYVADPPDLVTLEDTDGDGKADKRTVILTDFGHKDNGSLHGITFGPDGLLYGTMGEPDGYKLKGKDGKFLTGMSGMLFRCRPDGSDAEVLCRGFENLVEIVFMPNGDILGTCNWYQKPLGGIRDAIVHLVPGGLYPYVPDTGTAYPFTGDVIPPLALFPAVALSGMVRCEGVVSPAPWRGNLFTAQHNSRKVQRHVLTKSGASYTSQDFDFVTSENPDFHPSDVLLAPDGSLIVVDTGAWYVQHCPTGKIRNSRAPGGIYRVRYPEPKPALPNLGMPDDRPWGRVHSNQADARASGRVWSKRAEAGLVKMLSSKDPSDQLAAAEALATCGWPESLPAIWEALEATTDKFVEHQLVHAAYFLADAKALGEALKSESPRVQKAALVLLDQKGGAPEEAVIRRVGAGDPALRQAAIRILQKHKEWAPHAIELVKGWLKKKDLAEDEKQALRASVLAFQSDAGVQGAVAEAIREKAPASSLLIPVLAECSLPKFPESWKEALRIALPSADAIRTITVLQLPEFDEALAPIAEADGSARLAALRAIVPRRPKLSPASFDFLVSTLVADAPLDRLSASETLARARLADTQVARAVKAVRGDSLLSPSLFLPALRGPAGAELLSELTEAVKAGWRPSEQEMKPVFEAADGHAAALKEELAKGTEEQRATLEKHQPLLLGGDATRGRAVFFGKKVACSTCHAVGSEGGRIGPDLTKVGAIRSGRDLLESILVPSSTFAQGYEPYVIATKDGDVLGGLLARQDADAVVLKDASGAETRVRRDRIRDFKRGEKSLMPEGLERNLTAEEFRDLLAFLQQLK